MTFKEDIASDMDTFFDEDEFAESATYKGAAVSVVEDGQGATALTTSGTPGSYVPMFTIHAREAEIANPKPGEEIIFRDSTYKIGSNPTYDGGIWTINLEAKTKTVTV